MNERTMNDNQTATREDCIHGREAEVCAICQIAALTAEVERLEAALRVIENVELESDCDTHFEQAKQMQMVARAALGER